MCNDTQTCPECHRTFEVYLEDGITECVRAEWCPFCGDPLVAIKPLSLDALTELMVDIYDKRRGFKYK